MLNSFRKNIKLSDIFLFTLAFYPILKYNISSMALIGLSVTLLYESIASKSFKVSKKSVIRLLMLISFLLILFLSYFYSFDKQEAAKRIIRLAPLIVVPALIILGNVRINNAKRDLVLTMFLISNLIHITIIVSVYLFYIKNSGLTDMSFGALITNYREFQSLLDHFLGYDIITIHKAYFSMGYVLLAVYSLNKVLYSKKVQKVITLGYLLTFFIFSLLTLYTFSFPNVLALILLIVVLFIIKRTEFIMPKKQQILIIGSIAILVLSGIFLKSNSIDVKRGTNFIQSVINKSKIEQNDPRIEIYNSIYSIYKRATLAQVIFGFGIGDTQNLLNKEYQNRYSLKKNNKNELFFNEEFNNNYWFKNNIKVEPNVTNSPFGDQSADMLIESVTGISSSYNISITLDSVSNSTLTLSVFAKKKSASNLILRLGDIGQRASFDLNTGEYKVSDEKRVKAGIVNINGWYRCSITTYVKASPILLIGLTDYDDNYKYLSSGNSLYLWGAQLEKNNYTSAYKKNENELLKYVMEIELNTHNNYLYLFMAGGILCLLSFLFVLAVLFKYAIIRRDILQLSFCIIISLNLLTENIFSRHFGLIFTVFVLIIAFTNYEPEIESET